MLIAPQHLQNQDRYHEMALAQSLNLVAPGAWGLCEVKLDSAALAAGNIGVNQLAGRMPDGTIINIGANGGAAAIYRSSEGHFPPNQRVLEVYVGVARDREGVPSYLATGADNQPTVRYSVESRRVSDAAGSGSEVDLALAMPRFELLFGDDDRSEFECVKVAEVVRDKNGSLSVNERFVPLCLQIGASEFLLSGIRQLLALLVARQRDLAGSLRQGKGSAVEFGVGDVTRFLQLSACNEIIPVLRHLSESPQTSPLMAYWHLAAFYGRLCTFEVDADPADVPAYRSQDLGGTFEELFARIIALLQASSHARFIQIPLEPRDGIWFAGLENEKLLDAQLIFAVQNKNIPERQLAERLPRLSKVSSASGILPMIRVATLGVPLQFLEQPPPEIPVRAGVAYFNINKQDPNWSTVASEKTIGLFLPPPFDPSSSRIELFAVPRAAR
jgi:type VI secretion system protein ImpJ